MVSDKFFTYISRRLSAIKGNTMQFGSMNVICVGDFFQLRPIKGKHVFHNPLWKLFKPVFLDQNMRQQKDNIFVSLLNRARVGLLSPDDIHLLKSKIQKLQQPEICQVLHIFPRKRDVHMHNEMCQSTLSETTTTIPAIHFFSSNDPSCGQNITAQIIPSDDRIAGGLMGILTVSKNSRLMLIRNICTPDGLVNGAMGIVESIDCVDGQVQTIHILFDDPLIAYNPVSQRPNAVPIKPIEHTFTYLGHEIVRSQFPLIPCWACTVHKVQGLSLDKAALDLGSSIFERGMSYVALSRLRTLEGLSILRFDPTKIECADDVLEEYARLRNVLHAANNTDADLDVDEVHFSENPPQ
ncbi:ATP-dependent DNA helicase PIF1-like [Littorina saxatilis]|uniref:ATP-dependent DNA helicase PIF1-like n=1 Tax=Littorina saxatilis TaxID=31220 RepID=UPI0038B57071